MDEQYAKRIFSFAWRLGMMILAISLDFTAREIGVFELPAEVTVVLGLILGEISKLVANKVNRK